MENIDSYELDCGATLLVEKNPAMRSVGFTWLLPGGNAYDGVDRQGVSAAISDWLWRGAGDLDTRQLSDAFDRLGVQRSSGVETHHLQIGATLIGNRLAEALPLLTTLVCSPTLGDDSFEPIRDLCLQSIASLQDDPQTSCMLKLKEEHFPAPFNRSAYGTSEGLTALTADEARAHARSCNVPAGSIIGMSGDVDGGQIVDQLNGLFEGWGGSVVEPSEAVAALRGYTHIKEDSAQCHLGLAFDAPCEGDANSMLQRVASAVLSGGMGGRLFTEVREKRSLCYSVYASYSAGRDRGAVLAYAGTTPERAQETLDVMVGEFRKLREGIDEAEFDRALMGMKSRLVMHGESTAARAATIARDQYLIDRARTLAEIAAEVDAVTLSAVNAYLASMPEEMFTMVSLGPAALNPPTKA